MPEKVLKKINDNILPQWKVCFLASLIVGLIAHFYKITNWLPNWDSLVFRYDPQNMVGLGRWFLPVVCSFSSFYDLPFLNGIIAIIFHGFGAVTICRILNIKKKITAFLIGAVVVTFPTVTSVMMYNYVADGYSIAFFLSTLAGFYLVKEKPRYILSGLLIAFSTGIYQAYITVTVMLVLLKLIDDIIYNNASFVEILKRTWKILLTGILGMALYSIMLKIIMSAFSVGLMDYQGINSTASLSNIDVFGSLYVIKETFIKCFFDFSKGINVYNTLNVLVFIFTLAFSVKNIVSNKVYKSPVNIIVLIILGVLLILGAGVLAFINKDIDYHNLMLMGYSVFYLFFLVLYERGTDKNAKCWAILITAMVMIGNLVVISNVSYHKAQMAYEKSYGVLVRIADRIEQTPDAENCKKIVVVGALQDSEGYSVNLTPDITGITEGVIIRRDDETVGQSVLTAALNDYCGKDYKFLSGKNKEEFLNRTEVKAMPDWPAGESIMVIDETIVVKLSEEGEK